MIIISGVVLVITILIYCVFRVFHIRNILIFAPLDDKSYSYKNFFPVAWA